VLRAIEETDLQQLREWRNNPALRQYFREYRDLTFLDQARWFESLSGDDTKIMFAIHNKGLVGCCGLTNIDWVNRSAEVSIYIGEVELGKDPVYIDDKVAPAALKELMAYAFDECGLSRLWVEVFAFDTLKTNLFLGARFEKEGTLRGVHFTKGKSYDSNIYGYLVEEWRSA
jgi:RimJ/RimL family protein N-acetyltransferase